MRIVIAAVGRLKDGGESDLVRRYRERVDAAGRPAALGPLAIAELAEARQSDKASRMVDEAARLIDATAKCDARVVLDERGKAITSDAFAALIQKTRDGGARELAFLIGGADGHGPAVHALPGLKLSLGAMTLPHGLVRVILAEQIYRAVTILTGHPYHRA